MEEDWKEIKVFSLNFFGLYGISAKRKERVQALSHYLSAKEDYDIVLLQEVWTDEDYKTLKKNLILSGGPFKFSHYFDNGIIGTGTCIFSKSRIRFTTFHSFGLNGYPQSISHGDWFAAKGLGIAVLYIDGFEIHVYVSHYHAEYNPENDIYLGHRVVHALESAQWIQLTSASADLTIYAGDFNTEPDKVPLKLLKYITSLKDSWEEVHGSNANEEGATCETYYNSFTPESVKQACPEGKRIDYIMYQAGADTDVVTKDCILPLSKRVPATMGRLNKKLTLTKKANVASSTKDTKLSMSRIKNMTSLDLITLKKSSKIPQESTDILMLSARKLPEFTIQHNIKKEKPGVSLSRKMKKSDKMKVRKEFLLNKLSEGAKKMKADRATSFRRKRAVIGDLDPMKDTLEAIDKVLEKDDSRRNRESKKKLKGKRGTLKQKKRQNEFIKNASFFEAVKNHPEYAKNPFSTICTHIENKVAAEHLEKVNNCGNEG
uniref:sphingomyelin phosphodiesterase n=1 Tax=Lepeophtheirus salmonis TaxID=72036 RepID=A0A0K2TGK4_LEPSM